MIAALIDSPLIGDLADIKSVLEQVAKGPRG
jgi:hypothetical protein